MQIHFAKLFFADYACSNIEYIHILVTTRKRKVITQR